MISIVAFWEAKFDVGEAFVGGFREDEEGAGALAKSACVGLWSASATGGASDAIDSAGLDLFGHTVAFSSFSAWSMSFWTDSPNL